MLREKLVFSAHIPEFPCLKSDLESSIIVEEKRENTTTLQSQKRTRVFFL